MSASCGCMDIRLIFLTLILLTRFSHRVSGGGQWSGCSRLISISRRLGWARNLPGRWPDGGPWSAGGKWTQRSAALAHASIPDLTSQSDFKIQQLLLLRSKVGSLSLSYPWILLQFLLPRTCCLGASTISETTKYSTSHFIT